MTDVPSSEPLALLLAKMENHPDLRWYEKGLPDPTDVVVPLVDADLVTITASFGPGVSVALTDAGRALAARARADVLSVSDDPAVHAGVALWWWLLRNGSDHTRYGDEYEWGQYGEIAHILACGLDPKASTPVTDDSWTEWNGTFGPTDDRRTGVSGTAVCSCEKRVTITLLTEVESYTAFVTELFAL